MAVRRCVQNRCSAAHLSPSPLARPPAQPSPATKRPAKQIDLDGSGRIVFIEEDTDSNRGGVGGELWDGAVALALWLQHQLQPAQRAGLGEASVLELGAGTGLVGLSAAILCGAAVLMTDRGDGLQVSERCPGCARRSLQGEVAGRRSPSGTLGATPPRRYRTCFTPPT